MNDHTDNHDNHDNPELHLQADPQAQEMEALLDRLARADRDAMPADSAGRLMEAISGAIAPAPIAIAPARDEHAHRPGHGGHPGHGGVWRFRYAALLLVGGAALAVVATRPWGSAPTPTPPVAGAPNWSLASFERDLDEYLTLESLDDGQLTGAVTEWEIWAQAVGTEIESSMYGDDLYTSDDEGPTDQNGAL